MMGQYFTWLLQNQKASPRHGSLRTSRRNSTLNVSNFVLMAEMGFPIDPYSATTAESSSSSSSESDTSLDFDLSSDSGESDLSNSDSSTT